MCRAMVECCLATGSGPARSRIPCLRSWPSLAVRGRPWRCTSGLVLLALGDKIEAVAVLFVVVLNISEVLQPSQIDRLLRLAMNASPNILTLLRIICDEAGASRI